MDFEIVISDNFSENHPHESISFISDPRVRIVQPSKRLSMQEHYEFALGQAKGHWILLMGADDGILTGIFEKMDRLCADFPDIEVFNWRRAYYFWPGVEDIYGSLRLSVVSQQKVSVQGSSRKFFLALLGIQPMLDLPQIYTCSFVKRDLIERIKSIETKRIYPASIPDIYSSVAVLQNINKYGRSSSPLTLVGSSPTSLGIGNRIYDDNDQNSLQNGSILHRSTIREIHEEKINSYYLLDAYKSYCEFKNQKICNLKLIAGTIGTASEILYRGKILHFLPRIVDIYGTKLVLAFTLPLVLTGSLLGPLKLFTAKWNQLREWLIFMRSPNSWKIHISENSDLGSIQGAIKLVAGEVRKREIG